MAARRRLEPLRLDPEPRSGDGSGPLAQGAAAPRSAGTRPRLIVLLWLAGVGASVAALVLAAMVVLGAQASLSPQASGGAARPAGTERSKPAAAAATIPEPVGGAPEIVPRHGWAWGNRCWRLLRAGDLAAADAACDHGLAVPDVDPHARVALLYNKGLIAERRGDLFRAEAFFRRSLRLRSAHDPGRRQVQAALLRVLRRR